MYRGPVRALDYLPRQAHFHKHSRSTSSQTMGPIPLDTPVSLSPAVAEDELDDDYEANLHDFPYLHRSQPDPQLLQHERTHADLTLHEWRRLQSLIQAPETAAVCADHQNSLSAASVAAVAQHRVAVKVEDTVAAIRQVTASVDHLRDRLDSGHSLYGITTGFGGSANTRTDKPIDLQRALLQHQQSGILPVVKKANSIHASLKSSPHVQFMPEDWVRGAMLVRCKSLLNGHSALRYEAIEMLMQLLNKDIIPLVPLRGSISASGDLQPLSYIAGALEGNPDIWMWTNDGHGGRDLIPAPVALETIHRRPLVFGPKEGLAVLNGTAFSCAVGALALQDANHLAVLTQILTAIGVEALSGTTASFDPFFARVRPHRGQAEAANNIRYFLMGSALVKHEADAADPDSDESLRQDRYALRTASQWIGPQLEDLTLAHEQITTECNSTTDNPLVDVANDVVHHGGNFQAVAVTSAMEKVRLTLQMFGRILFAQCTELINPATNNGLPPNLAADEPSTSYTFKGIDINIAAYQSELAYLANPVGTHVQTAEMVNQAVNSLALISARHTHHAIDVLFNLCAAYLYALCQALDLRAMHVLFMRQATDEVQALTEETFEYVVPDPLHRACLSKTAIRHLEKQVAATTHMDSSTRFTYIADAVQGALLTSLLGLSSTTGSTSESPAAAIPPQTASSMLELLREWHIRCAARLAEIHTTNRTAYLAQGSALPSLGRASRVLYSFVRQDLAVPMHAGLSDCPSTNNGKRTVGGNASIIYEALRNGRLMGVCMDLLERDQR